MKTIGRRLQKLERSLALEVGPAGLWLETARSLLADHGCVQNGDESFAETMARVLGIGTDQLQILIAQGQIASDLLGRFGERFDSYRQLFLSGYCSRSAQSPVNIGFSPSGAYFARSVGWGPKMLVNTARLIASDRPSRPAFRKFLEWSPNSLALSTSKTTRCVRLRYVRLVSALPLRLAQKLPGS